MQPEKVKIFDHQRFQQRLAVIPKDVLFEMARDGIIDVGEVRRLLILLGIDMHEVEAMQHHFHLIGQTVLRYYERTQQQEMKTGVCIITGAEAVGIMQQLLDRGLIGRYYEKVLAPSLQSGLPGIEKPPPTKSLT